MKKDNFYIGTTIRKKNRDKILAPRSHKYWCKKCDCQLTGDYGKCPNCGYRNNRKKFKRT